MTLRLIAAVLVLGASAVICGAATAARPTSAGHYYGFQVSEASPGNPLDVSAELRVAYGGRRFASGSSVHLYSYCPRSLLGVAVSLGHVRINRRGRVSLAGERQALRYRLKGRFLSPEYARITYTLTALRRPQSAPRCHVPPYPVALYRNGERPFS